MLLTAYMETQNQQAFLIIIFFPERWFVPRLRTGIWYMTDEQTNIKQTNKPWLRDSNLIKDKDESLESSYHNKEQGELLAEFRVLT